MGNCDFYRLKSGNDASGSDGNANFSKQKLNALLGKKKKRPLILVTNDDGVEARGIQCLIEAVCPLGEVVVVALMVPGRLNQML